MVRKWKGKNEKTEKWKLKTADKISYFGQRRHLALTKKLSVHKKTRFIQSRLFYSLKTAYNGVKRNNYSLKMLDKNVTI